MYMQDRDAEMDEITNICPVSLLLWLFLNILSALITPPRMVLPGVDSTT